MKVNSIQDSIELAFQLVKNRCSDNGLEHLPEQEKILWLVWSALGILKVDGLHGYLFWLDTDVPREDVVVAFMDLGFDSLALNILAGGEVLLKYLSDTGDDEMSSSDMRQKFDKELTSLEMRIYKMEPKVTKALWPISMSILGKMGKK